ncbi:MAG: GNAT family N-acetyltransferase, partial [Myxococcaceae bacterium]
MSGADLVIRPAGPADDEAIGELLVEAFLEKYSKKMPEVVITGQRKGELRAVAEKRAVARVWVAEAAGKVVGTVSLWPPGAQGSEAWKPNAADLRHLGVSASHRGRGVSRTLLD